MGLTRIYNRFPKGGMVRRWVLQVYLVALQLFHIMLFMMPFMWWRRAICRLCGISLGAGAVVHGGVRFMAFGNCEIGKNTVINRDCIIDNRRIVKIGDNVSVGTRTMVWTSGHDLADRDFVMNGAPVIIDDLVCIFAGCQIMPGVRIETGAAVYPGAVVTARVGPWCIVGGVPARALGRREPLSGYTLDGGFWYA